MSKFMIKIFAAIAVVITIIPSAHALDAAEKEEFGKFIREYLIENPEVLAEAQAVLETRLAAQEKKRATDMISGMSDDLYNAVGDIIVGNPDADVTIVEFYDYNCGYCKRAMTDMQEIVAKDPNVKFVLKEFPILGPESIEATRVSLAVARVSPEKSAEFHVALLSGNGRADKNKAMGIAEDLGIDLTALEKELADEALLDPISTTYRLAQDLGINGTPSYVIGNEAIYGAVGVEQLVSKIDNMRKCGETNCS